MSRPSKGVGVANWLVSKTSGFLDARLSRRSFISRATLAGTAVAATGCAVITRPGSPYVRIADCPPGTLCHDGYTEFCCVINQGVNACPPGTISAGWWRADYSVFCHGTRYYIDCNEVCCGPQRSDGFCAGCHACECAAGCDTRKVHCSYFRYGQCHQMLAHVGPIACRMVTCVPPYQLGIGCTASGAVDNSTAGHFADCAKYAPVPPAPPPMASVVPALGGATVATAGSLAVFSRFEDQQIWARRSGAGVWTDWEPVGGKATSGGRAVTTSSGEMLVFARLDDKALWYWRFDGSAWIPTSLGGRLTSDPVALAHNGRVFVFARLDNYGFWWRGHDGSTWSRWNQLFGVGTSTPAVVSDGTSLHVFGRLNDKAVWYSKSGNPWSAPVSLGGSITSDPGAAWFGGKLFVFGRTDDRSVTFRASSGSSWSPWVSLGGQIVSDPVGVVLGTSLLVLARFDRGELWYRRTADGLTWDPWTAVGSPPVMSDPTVTVDGSTLHVLASFGKTRLGHVAFDGSAWTVWEDLGGQLALVRGS